MAEEQEPESQRQSAAAPQKPARQASSEAIIALVLGIVGAMVALIGLICGPLVIVAVIFGILAWIIGQKERNAIKRGESPQSGLSLATTGWILGIISTILGTIVFIISIIALIYIIGTDTNSFNMSSFLMLAKMG